MPEVDLQAPSDARPAEPAAHGRHRTMRLSRRFEETVHEQFEEGQVPGPLHLSIGQEAVAVGACFDLRQTDAILSTHRGHHHCLAKGADPDRLMAELLGRTTGYSHGRGGSMHVAVPELGILGTNGIVGVPGANGPLPLKRVNDAYVLDDVSTLSPSMILNARNGWSTKPSGCPPGCSRS